MKPIAKLLLIAFGTLVIVWQIMHLDGYYRGLDSPIWGFLIGGALIIAPFRAASALAWYLLFVVMMCGMAYLGMIFCAEILGETIGLPVGFIGGVVLAVKLMTSSFLENQFDHATSAANKLDGEKVNVDTPCASSPAQDSPIVEPSNTWLDWVGIFVLFLFTLHYFSTENSQPADKQAPSTQGRATDFKAVGDDRERTYGDEVNTSACPKGWAVDIDRPSSCVFAGGSPKGANITGPCEFKAAMSDQDFINCGRTPPR